MEKSNYIFVYTRKKAIEDGVLVDITEIAKHYGFVISVPITANLMDTYVKSANNYALMEFRGLKVQILSFRQKLASKISGGPNIKRLAWVMEIGYIKVRYRVKNRKIPMWGADKGRMGEVWRLVGGV